MLISNETDQADVPSVPAQATEPGTTQPSYITTEQLNQVVGKLEQKLDQLYRGVQSREDQFTAKVNRKIETLEMAAQKQGVRLDDAQRKSMRDQAIYQTLSEETSSTPSGAGPGQVLPQGVSEQELIDRVNQAAITMQVAAGLEIEENDPENAIITAAEEGTPGEYLAAVQKAIDAKQARLKSSPSETQPAAPGGIKSPGVVKGVPQSNPIENITDLDELWKLSSFGKG